MVRRESPSLGSMTGEPRMALTAGKLLHRMSIERESYDQDHLKQLLVSCAEPRNSASDAPGSLTPELRSLGEEWGMSAPVISQD
jgi:hypothetical protein